MSAAVALDIAANQTGNRPRVSVVVSTRNHARYLGDTLRGFEAQALADADLVVVDNASTDDTQSVMTDFLARTTRPVRYVRFAADQGPANGRNHGLGLARGEYVAFTDSDCVPSPQWLSTALEAFTSAEIGIVQGRTECAGDHAPMFSHFIETRRFDGSFSTSNVVYRRRALGEHAFDRSCAYWEDTDLGCRVRADGWEVVFAPEALVHHQIVPQSPLRWLLWPTRYANWPAKAARYPAFRESLFLGVWVRPLHALFDLALVGTGLTLVGRRRLGLALVAPYAVAFARTRGLQGRAPVAKAGMYVARDAVALCSLVAGSIRNRTVVL